MDTATGLSFNAKRDEISEESIQAVIELGALELSALGNYTCNHPKVGWKTKTVPENSYVVFEDCYDSKKKGLMCIFSADESLAKGLYGTESDVTIEIPLTDLSAKLIGGDTVQDILLQRVVLPKPKAYTEVSEIEALLIDEEEAEMSKLFGAFS